MIQELADKRSEFRFPVVVPAEYFNYNDTGILSYALNLSKSGTFISSDNPIGIGSKFGINLTIQVNDESSKIFRTEGSVAWTKVQPFKSKSNGMGIRFIDPLPESLLLNALANSMKKLTREIEAKNALEERVEKLELELEEAKRLATLGRCVEKILFDLSNPILALSGKLELIKTKMYRHKGMIEEEKEIDKKEFNKLLEEFSDCCKNVDRILKDYKVISELAHIVGDNTDTLEQRLLQRYSY